MIKKLWKNLMALTMSAVLAGTMCGCGNNDAGSQSSSPAPADAAQSASGGSQTPDDGGSVAGGYEGIQKPDSITWCSHSGLLVENGQAEWDAEFERLTGIDLNHIFVSNNEYNGQIELYYSANTVPDVFDLSSSYFPKYASEGALADLTDLVKESGLYEIIDKEYWDQCSYQGKIYGVPWEIPQACGTYVRKDWLDRLGMEVPTTYDEFITMLTRFRDEIDECLVPYTAPGLTSAQYLADFYQGADAGIVKVDGVWVDGMQQANIAIALQNMQDAYAEGLLDMEVITNTTSTCRDAWNSGTTGAFCYWAGNWGDQLTVNVQKNVPDAEVVCIPALAETVYLYSTPTVHVINGRLSEEEIAQVFKYFIAYMHDGGEGQVLFEYGVEGVHWEQDGDNVKMLPSLSDSSVTLNKCYTLPSSRITPLNFTDKNMDYSDAYMDSLAATADAAKREFQPPSETYSLISSELTTARDSIIAEIVMGNVSVEDGLAAYKEKAESLNLNKALEEMNAQ